MEERKNVYLSLHKSFVREGIEYTDRATGEARTFNSATLPKGTVVASRGPTSETYRCSRTARCG